ncbi:MAG: hypothetical protein UR28_C0001G0095 [Candidatus Peregrinibacteria bacterium GW2011_GWF2_33_10]|nr:MAG: hypothetical protein UR28_C0001G0095 [Candidatus Peregrinibacteria bacterium GW2011_GWF2_33_10]OGJ44837.1 MAG: hypothetical protein A2263_06400 [Candidatus Peregrinibacteria bacterium RIFOXYA2_FULL_33_21]OGJ47123.1 MAG: hypothetical protein A2272_03120 [Candidatus Peregrinibacteria bacterium RIFOXYA12_FULL_33_12]OGJ50523.1 MAG: hypothetical protein A2307_03025 [Candidatus Peregrinibacteria bacterium RIFOXYB2_FULL_33_20]
MPTPSLQILFQDENYLGFFKPSGLPTSFGKNENYFLNIVKQNYPELFTFIGFKAEEGGLLYRLDNEACGLLLFAKNKKAFDEFINDVNLEKIYLAEVLNLPKRNSVPSLQFSKLNIINFPIVHKSSKKMAVLIPGKKITYQSSPIFTETKYQIFSNSQLLKCFIKKGVRHQIRVHLASIDCPIINDQLYNKMQILNSADHLHLCCIGIKSEKLNIDVLNKLKGLVGWLS